jgi:hypothetical protein
MAGWVDVAIPAVIGLLLVVSPRSFIKPTGIDETDRLRVQRLRGIGLLLTAIAGGYFFIRLAGG